MNKNLGIKKIRLVCDSCGGQNKNYAMLSMINTFENEYKIRIEWIFPIVDYSYMPPDRAFGRVEKLLSKEEILLQLKDYFEIFSQVGTIFEIAVNWKLYDWKKWSTNILKSKQNFKSQMHNY